ncbi:hypothetical protein HAX54_023899 [Datura stramonium]|uniref:Ribosomal RNA-processing protein 43 n=1 Tax=Datura stramonium TaxID=4076 RepID=A0ABS8S4Y7_DATST|nr:hypothetical protein [Datura stramonium]
MAAANGSSDLYSELEVDAFRSLFPLRYHEQHLLKSVRPDARKLGSARDTTVALGAVASADGSALVKIGSTVIGFLASITDNAGYIKLEVMTPTVECPDEGSIAIEFYMPPICSPLVRPGGGLRKQHHSGMIDLKELCLVGGKAAWMAYLLVSFYKPGGPVLLPIHQLSRIVLHWRDSD